MSIKLKPILNMFGAPHRINIDNDYIVIIKVLNK